MPRLLPLLYCLLLSPTLPAQNTDSLYHHFDIPHPTAPRHHYPVLSLASSFGYNLLNGTIPAGFVAPPLQALDVRFGGQTTGRHLYQELWRYPAWGGGLYAARFANDTLFGAPLAAFAYIDVPARPYAPDRKWNYGLHLSGGLSGNMRRYDRLSNPRNRYVSSRLNTHLDVGAWVSRRLSARLGARAGLSLIHFSNGAWRQPNLGLNLLGATVQLQYFPRGRPPIVRREAVPEWRRRHGWFVSQSVGAKRLSIGGEPYLNTTTSLAYRWWSGYRHRWLGQLDIFYDGSNNSGEPRRDFIPPTDRDNAANFWSMGLFVGHDAVYNRWSVLLGGGLYVWRRYPYEKLAYQRFGLRYRLWRGLEVGVVFKGRSFGADYIEWTVGYGSF